MNELKDLVSNYKSENFGRIVELLDPVLKAELRKGHHKESGLGFDDILQNTWMDLHDILSNEKFDPSLSSFKTFAIKILKNKSCNEGRKNCRFNALKEKLRLKENRKKIDGSGPVFETIVFHEYLEKWKMLGATLDFRTRKILCDLQNHPVRDVKVMNNLSDLQFCRMKKNLITVMLNTVFGLSRI